MLKLIWVTRETKDKEKELRKLVSSAIGEINDAKKSLTDEVQKMIHNAYAGIVCDRCGKNVFRGEGTWVHGNGGKAYCLDPCWKDLQKELNNGK